MLFFYSRVKGVRGQREWRRGLFYLVEVVVGLVVGEFVWPNLGDIVGFCEGDVAGDTDGRP